jgi:hypothetical protein
MTYCRSQEYTCAMRNPLRSTILLIAALVCLAPRTHGQGSFSTLRGVVTDASGAVVASANIVLKEPSTGVLIRDINVDAQGSYEIPSLRAGIYTLTCTAAGFAPFTADQIALASGQLRRIDVTLSVAGSSQSVSVTAGVAVINTESGTIGGVYDAGKHADVPLVDAYPSPSAMLTVIPGFQGGSGGLGGVRANGQPLAQIIVAIDGINNDSAGQVVNSEQYEEVNATLVNAPAESSRVASVQLITKRGANEIHGVAYYKFFSSAFNARSFFAARRTPYLQHEWDLEAGGPIVKNRTFFYGSWFSQRIPLGSFSTATVPTLAMRNGAFSGVVRDPQTNQPFPGNQIPANRISSVSAKLQEKYYPLPTSAAAANNLAFEVPFPADLFRGDWLFWRLDHNFSSKNSADVRWTQRKTPYVLSSGLPGQFWTRKRDHQQWVASDTHIFSPSLVNTFQFGLSTDYIVDGDTVAGRTPLDGSNVLSEIGLIGSNPSGFKGQGFPTVSVTGLTALSLQPGGIVNDNSAYTINEAITKTKGHHVWKSGATVQWQKTFAGEIPNYGSFSFDGTLSGAPYADFLLGFPRSTSRTNPIANRHQNATEIGFFTQDTYKVTSRLTLEYGLRWDYYTTPVYSDGLMYNFDKASGSIIVQQESLAKISPLYPKNILIRAGDPKPVPSKSNFRPRLSAAFRITPKFVVRGGYGMFTERIALFQRVSGGGPFQIAETYQNQAGQTTQLNAFPNPYPASLALATLASQSVVSFPSQTSNGILHQYNVTVERELFGFGVRGSYVGTQGRGLNYSLNINQPEPSLVTFNVNRRPYPNLVGVTNYRSDGSSRYHSFQVEAKKRAASVLFDFNYSYQINQSNFVNLENPYDVLSKWSNDASTRRHYAVGSLVWTLPVGKGQRYLTASSKLVDTIVGNWQVYWLSYLASGFFFSPAFSGSSPSNTGVNGGLPDLVGDPSGIPRSVNQWFDPKAFAVPPAGRFGNALPNSLVSQPLNVHHLSLIRKFPIKERLSFTLTAAISNIFNHATFNNPLSNISVAGAGAFTSTVGVFSSNERGAYRQMALKGRFDF